MGSKALENIFSNLGLEVHLNT